MRSFLVILAVSIMSVMSVKAQQADVSVRFLTYNGMYAPRNVVAIWVTDASNHFIKTLRVAGNYPDFRRCLRQWISHSNYNVVDAVTSASYTTQGTRTASWDCTDQSGNEVSDGTYRIWYEQCESNGYVAAWKGPNDYIQFTKGSSDATVNGTDTYFSPGWTGNPNYGSSVKTMDRAVVTYTAPAVANPGIIDLSASFYSVAEDGNSVTITVVRSGGSDGTVSVHYATGNGTAAAGSDYTATSGTLTWTNGQNGNKTFTINITDDTADESDETVTITLSSPTGGATLGTPNTATLTITDDDVPGVIDLSSATYSVNENAGTATITAVRAGGSDGSVSVSYATSNGTATAGSDYTAKSGTLTWSNGQGGSKTFTVSITDDAADESNETVTITLSNPTGGASLGTPKTATLTIVDDDDPGVIDLSASSYSVNENGGTVTITAVRSGGSDGTVGVSYATSNGTATAGQDYTAAGGTLSWADGVSGNKTFTVAISNDVIDENSETVIITLSNATGGASLGTPKTATLTIVDDDVPGTIDLSAATYGVAEDGGTVTVTAVRSGGTSGPVSVSYATSNGSAVAGQDYTAASGTVSWANGESGGKTFTVSITDDAADESSETFGITLSSVTGGAALGSPAAATVTIVDNDDPGVIALSSASYTVAENGGSATVTAVRTGGSSGAVGVSYATGNGTATAGQDYTAASGTLSWSSGETGGKTFTVPVTDDAAAEAGETVTITLSSATGGAALGTPKTATLTITDDDGIASLDSALLCHWTFDGNVDDQSGNGNNGTLVNAPSYITGHFGQGLSLNGVNQYVNGADIDFASAPFSISVWFKSGVVDAGPLLHKITNNQNQNYYIYPNTSGGAFCGLWDGNGWQEVNTGDGAAVNDNQWHHMAMVVDAANINIFLDGTYAASKSHDNSFPTNDANFFVGKQNNAGNYYTGAVDELRIYGRTLTAADVAALANGNAPQPGQTLDSMLVAYWAFDDGSGSTVTDSSTNGDDGALAGTADWVAGRKNGALQFDGSTNYFEVPNRAGDDFSVSAWIKMDGPSHTGNDGYEGSCIIWADAPAPKNDYAVSVLNEHGAFFTGNPNTTIEGTSDIADGTWHHVVAVREKGVGKYMYVDGVLEATGTTNANTLTARNPLGVGGHSAYTKFFGGCMDELRIYGRVLTRAEIAALGADTTVTVPEPNIAPTADAGSDMQITLPVNSVALSGSGDDADGSVAAYAWSVVSGPASGLFETAAAAATNVLSLVEGTYVFRLTVTDDDGATGTDDVQVVVNPEPVNAITDITLQPEFRVSVPGNSLPFSITAVRAGQADVHIYDASGIEVLALNGIALTVGENAVGGSVDLQPGLYLIYVRGDGISWAGKTVIMK